MGNVGSAAAYQREGPNLPGAHRKRKSNCWNEGVTEWGEETPLRLGTNGLAWTTEEV